MQILFLVKVKRKKIMTLFMKVIINWPTQED